MLLTIDIGNTITKFGVFDGDRLTSKLSIPTLRMETAAAVHERIRDRIPPNISGVAVSSVVRELRESYHMLAMEYLGRTPLFVDHTLDFGYPINYDPPEDCGPDRLTAAFAAVTRYGRPVIVCDLGTATNIEVVDRDQGYLGGAISPGPGTMATALYDMTSRLPEVDPERPDRVIGNSTESSILSGLFHGYIGLVDGIVRRMLEEIGGEAEIVATGGYAELIRGSSEYIDIVEENLVLDGLRLLHERNSVHW